MRRPNPGEYAPYAQHYIDLTRGANILQQLDDSGALLIGILGSITDAKGEYAYEEGKWSIKQMFRHIIDADLVFLYRAVSIARGEKIDLPGFEQDDWAQTADLSSISLTQLIEEFSSLRSLIMSTFRGFNTEDLERKGSANGAPVNVLSLGFIIAGHSYHHINVLKERYL